MEIIWTRQAENDLYAIIRYIKFDNITVATTVFNRIKEKCDELVYSPERGRVISELSVQGLTHYREIIIKPWRIMYRISGQAVYVLSVIDFRRNVEDILLDRFVRID